MQNKIRLALLLAVAALPLFAAPQRFGAVNLEKVFREYYKTAVTSENIRKQAQIYSDYIKKLNGELLAMQKKSGELLRQSQNAALPDKDRERFKEEFEALSREFQAKRAELERYGREKSGEMRELELRKRTELIEEITGEVHRRAAAGGFDFVLDSSGKTAAGAPAVLVSSPSVDLTDEVIRELNRGRKVPEKSDGAATATETTPPPPPTAGKSAK